MGKLANIRAQMETPKPARLEGILESIACGVACQVSEELAEALQPYFTRQAHGLNLIQGELSDLNDTLERDIVAKLTNILKPAFREAVEGLKPLLNGIRSEIKASAMKESAVVDALSRVRIPDYSTALQRLEAKNVDLSGLSEQIDGVMSKLNEEPDDDPKEWVFDIQRGNNGLIKTVTAVAK